MKQREQRRKVLISARMRCGASWTDACILNLSKRGMLVQAPSAPSRGSYLEIRRGAHMIVARVVWANANRFGLLTQDDVPASALMADGSTDTGLEAEKRPVDRRRNSRRACAHEASRVRGRAMEFATFGLVATIAASLMTGAVSQLLTSSLTAVRLALHSH